MDFDFTPLTDPQYQAFKDKVTAHQHSIINFVSIAELRAKKLADDTIANLTSEYFDSAKWSNSPTIEDNDPWWARVDEAFALKPDGFVDTLAGGPNFGHREYAIQPTEAKKLWEEFLNFFDKDTRILYSVVLGDSTYTFSTGILIVDKDKAGVFNVLSND